MKGSSIFLLFFIFFCFSTSIVFASGTIDINNASLAQLDEIAHVGPKTAQKIIEGRPYSSVQDLSRVKGIGNGKYLQDIVSQGLACVNCQTTTMQTPTASPTPVSYTAPSPSPTPILTPSPTFSPTPTPVVVYPNGIFINEIMPNPSGADETNEWIELYNSNNFDADLSGWQIQDTEGTPTTYTIPQSTKILSYGFLVFKRPDTNITLNNDEDGLNLLTPDKKIVDSMSFTTAPLNQSYNKISSGSWQWSTDATPGSKNIIPSANIVTSNKALPKAKNSAKNNGVSAVADISGATGLAENETSGGLNPWFLFFIVLAVTIVLAATVLLIKIKISKK